ncbi:hypothetical protein MNBD_GAMMA10-445 [hydrothermal vent metagenome]|uniref:WGR domain-containing protein n=1 Tax=hydrothermal vent metagenome TaxID=652676 RepID=A0A3B0XKF0_9ZZZZ
MKKRLEYNDDKSSKFWEIVTEGDTYTVCYGRIGTAGQQKSKSFADADKALIAAEKLIAQKKKKGYQGVDGKGGASSEKTSSSSPAVNSGTKKTPKPTDTENKKIIKDMQQQFKKAGAKGLDAVLDQHSKTSAQVEQFIACLFAAFTWIEESWSPSWIDKIGGKRISGYPVDTLQAALAELEALDQAAFVRMATLALPYVVTEGEAMDHTEDFERWEAFRDAVNELEPHLRKLQGTLAKDMMLAVELQMELIGRSTMLDDPLAVHMALVESGIDESQKNILLSQLIAFASDGRISFALNYDGLSEQSVAEYIKKAHKMLPGNGLVHLFELMAMSEESAFQHGRAVGNDEVVYWPAINRRKNDQCHIVMHRKGKAKILGTFDKIPKILALAGDALYFSQPDQLGRYINGKWSIARKVTGGIQDIKFCAGRLYVVDEKPALHVLDKGEWVEYELPGSPGFCSVAIDKEGVVWVAGTAGRVLRWQDDSWEEVIPADKAHKNYRLMATMDDLYLHCTSGVYKWSGKAWQRMFKDKPIGIEFCRDRLYVATRESNRLVQLKGKKVEADFPVDTTWLGCAGERICAPSDYGQLIYDGNSWALYDIAAKVRPVHVKL